MNLLKSAPVIRLVDWKTFLRAPHFLVHQVWMSPVA
jgi:hypothetical protein